MDFMENPLPQNSYPAEGNNNELKIGYMPADRRRELYAQVKPVKMENDCNCMPANLREDFQLVNRIPETVSLAHDMSGVISK